MSGALPPIITSQEDRDVVMGLLTTWCIPTRFRDHLEARDSAGAWIDVGAMDIVAFTDWVEQQADALAVKSSAWDADLRGERQP